MNLFNSFQAVGFYSALPLLIQWLNNNGYTAYSIIAGAAMFIGYIALSFAVHGEFK